MPQQKPRTRRYSGDGVLTVEEVATRLRVDRRTVYGAIERSELGAIRIGNRHIVPEGALKAFMAGQPWTGDCPEINTFAAIPVLPKARRTPRGTLSFGDRIRFIEHFQRTCQYCNRQGASVAADPDGDVWTVDHLRPISRGGTDIQANLTLACAACNRRKRNYLPEELPLVGMGWKPTIVGPVARKRQRRWPPVTVADESAAAERMERLLFGEGESCG